MVFATQVDTMHPHAALQQTEDAGTWLGMPCCTLTELQASGTHAATQDFNAALSTHIAQHTTPMHSHAALRAVSLLR